MIGVGFGFAWSSLLATTAWTRRGIYEFRQMAEDFPKWRLTFTQIGISLRRSRAAGRGRIAIVTARWRGWRWTLWRQAGFCWPDENARSVRRSRVVLAPRPWRYAGGSFSVGNGGKKGRFPGESTKETVKPLRGESRDCLAEPVVTTLVCFFVSHARLRAQSAPGFPCALSQERGQRDAKLGR
jgi:hypothetical protein